MKRKTIIASLLLNAVMVHATAQETTCHFYSLEYLSINCQDEEEAGDMHEQTDSTMHITQERMSVEEIESLIAYYENKIATRDSLAARKSHVSKPKVFSYVEWTPRELNLENLKRRTRRSGTFKQTVRARTSRTGDRQFQQSRLQGV